MAISMGLSWSHLRHREGRSQMNKVKCMVAGETATWRMGMRTQNSKAAMRSEGQRCGLTGLSVHLSYSGLGWS